MFNIHAIDESKYAPKVKTVKDTKKDLELVVSEDIYFHILSTLNVISESSELKKLPNLYISLAS